MSNPGLQGEEVVAQWLQQQGARILHRRWRCRWGELDLVVQWGEELVFVEVKTRSAGNWDGNGLLALSSQKQAKLRSAAEFFLGESPQWCEAGCRFDVALVYYQPVGKSVEVAAIAPPVTYENHQFLIIDYLQDAFSG
ncbi:YraN family protein [Roseofilum sp. BLCC_M91]|uniref:UPF0102 protein PJF56_14830 n=1 Tax=Roseofilum halophilum BLCC-M91 TaxID=3022259 RepID=A0ABT7BLR3_9CYAN|nr:YraN family protein [Roseofilum halophilum]MDJ1180138.1 YraN family protein [Roseofilum halophilum BLCC-M91]